MRIHVRNELLAINLWSGCLALVIAFVDVQPLRLILAFPFLLFSPGYSLVAALFPEKSRLGTFERIALSISLSVALVPLMGLLLNYAWEVQVYPIVTALAGFVAVSSGIAWRRRRGLPPGERPDIRLHLAFPRSGSSSRLDRALTILLIAVVIAAIGVFSYLIVRPKVGEKFTEFYILGPQGQAAGYPTELVTGEEASITLGIINREQETMTYQVRWTIPGALDETLGPFTLAHGEKKEQPIAFALQTPTALTTIVEEANPESKDDGPPGMTKAVRVASTAHLEPGDFIWVGNEVDRVQAVEGADIVTLEQGLTQYHAAGTEVREVKKVEFKLCKVRELREGSGDKTTLALWAGKAGLHAVVTNRGKDGASYRITVITTDHTVPRGKEHGRFEARSPVPVARGESWDAVLEYPLIESYSREMEISLYQDAELLFREKTPNAYPELHFWLSVRQE